MDEKLLPANLTIMYAYPEAFANPQAPTAAELNAQFAFTPTASQGNMVFNLSCSVLDDYTLNQTDSDTDDTRTICDEGEVSNPTFMNFEASIDTLRDASVTDAGLFNMAAELTRAPDRPGIWIKRDGFKADTPFAIGQEVSLFPTLTDYPQDVVDAGSLLSHGARLIPDGAPTINYRLVA